jgi:hypothetical protein
MLRSRDSSAEYLCCIRATLIGKALIITRVIVRSFFDRKDLRYSRASRQHASYNNRRATERDDFGTIADQRGGRWGTLIPIACVIAAVVALDLYNTKIYRAPSVDMQTSEVVPTPAPMTAIALNCHFPSLDHLDGVLSGGVSGGVAFDEPGSITPPKSP